MPGVRRPVQAVVSKVLCEDVRPKH
jgi:hypothetical protein